MQITDLELLSSNIPEQQRFYSETLGLPLVKESNEAFTVRVGTSRLTFRHAPDEWTGFYHFAFNIPENRFSAAKTWLAERVDLVRDSADETEIAFPDWNAHALYFYDRGGHLAELIARHSLLNATETNFDACSLLCVSEIGIVADDVAAAVRSLREKTGASIYRGDAGDTFAAVGDEHGLVIVVKRGRIWFMTDQPAEPNPAVAKIVPANTADAAENPITLALMDA